MKQLMMMPLVILALTSAANAMTVESGKVQFLAVATAGIKIVGDGAVPQGEMNIKDGKAAGEFKIDLAAFKTGMEKRDTHMKDALEVEKYPTATLTFKDVAVVDGAAKASIPAELDLHGTKKPVMVDAEFKDGKATGKFKVKLSEFAIKAPTFAGMSVKDDVEITIDSVLK